VSRDRLAGSFYYRSRFLLGRPVAAGIANRIKTSPNVWYGDRGWMHLLAAVDRYDLREPAPPLTPYHLEMPMILDRPPVTAP